MRGACTKHEARRDIVLDKSLAKTARSIRYTGILWQDYIFTNPSSTPTIDSVPGWIQAIQNLPESKALALAKLSISSSYLGVRDGNADLKFKGLQTYAQTLEEVRKSLMQFSPENADADSLLAAVNILSIYEVSWLWINDKE